MKGWLRSPFELGYRLRFEPAERTLTLDPMRMDWGPHFKAEVKEIIRGKVDYAKARGKELAGRAKDSAMKLNRAARKSSQEAKKGLLRSIEKDPSAARVIAFEAGALLVMIGQRLMKRKAATPSHVLPEQKITLEEAQEKVKAAALAPEEKLKKAA